MYIYFFSTKFVTLCHRNLLKLVQQQNNSFGSSVSPALAAATAAIILLCFTVSSSLTSMTNVMDGFLFSF